MLQFATLCFNAIESSVVAYDSRSPSRASPSTTPRPFLPPQTQNRGAGSYLNLGGQVVVWHAAVAATLYSTKTWMDNCPPASPAPL